MRYSFQKTHRIQPASLPHGDAGVTFGAGDGNIKAQGLAFNDTHILSNHLLNEARFGWTSIKFFMTPIDYLQNPAAAVGLADINLNDATSGMTQLTFQNIRNLGANSNQPLITNQNDFSFADNVTWTKGKQTIKMGGNLILRSREILNADTIVGQFGFNNNMTSNCAGQPAGCTVNSATGFDVASFELGLTSAKNRNLFDANTYTEKRPEIGAYLQDDYRVTSKLTVNMGLRYDVFPAWEEIDNRQSNFDVTTGHFVLAADGATIDGVTVGRRLQTYSKGDLGPRAGFAYDLSGDGKTLVRGGYGIYWNFSPGGTSSSKAQNQPFLQSTALTPTPSAYGSNLLLKDGLPPPPGVNPSASPTGSTRSIFDINFRDAYARQWNINTQRGLGTNYLVEVAYVGSQGRQIMIKTRREPGAARRRRDRRERQPAVHHHRPAAAHARPGAEQRDARLQRAAGEVPAAVRQPLLVPELVYVGPGARSVLGQRRHRHADQYLRSAVQPRSGRLRHQAHVLVELGLRDPVGARRVVRRLAAGRHHAASAAACR